MMDDATRALVNEARRWAGGSTTSPVGANLVQDLADALEAAQRPPVSPEQREALKREAWRNYQDRVLVSLDPDTDEWPSRFEVFHAGMDAILAFGGVAADTTGMAHYIEYPED